MKIEEINRLVADEKAGALRMPQPAIDKSQEEINKIHACFSTLVLGIVENPFRMLLTDGNLVAQRYLYKNGIFKLITNPNSEYLVRTEFGLGSFYDARTLFEDNIYPKYIKEGLCFSNCYAYLIENNFKGKIVSGIVCVDKPYLHSVLEVGNKIIDFSHHIVMSKRLYNTLTNFETLAVVEGTEIEKNLSLLKEKASLENKAVNSITLNFAHEEVIELLKGRDCNR